MGQCAHHGYGISLNCNNQSKWNGGWMDGWMDGLYNQQILWLLHFSFLIMQQCIAAAVITYNIGIKLWLSPSTVACCIAFPCKITQYFRVQLLTFLFIRSALLLYKNMHQRFESYSSYLGFETNRRSFECSFLRSWSRYSFLGPPIPRRRLNRKQIVKKQWSNRLSTECPRFIHNVYWVKEKRENTTTSWKLNWNPA